MTNPSPVRGPVTDTTWKDVPTRTVDIDGTSFAYRELGPRGGTPLVLLHHFTAILDDWDPRVVDGIAAHRHVVTFDNRGVGATGGKVPHTIAEMAADAVAFIRGLGYKRVDLLGFSLGGGLTRMPLVVGSAYLKAALTRRDPRTYLFFNRNAVGKRTATDYLARLHERTTDRDKAISHQARIAQLLAIREAGLGAPHDLGQITQPTFVANGDNDTMVASSQSHILAERIPNATLTIYPDSGHGGIFQHHQHFVPEVLAFLDAG